MNRPDKPAVPALHRFHDAVFRPGHFLQILSQIPDSLVMVAVHPQASGAQQRFQRAAQPHLVNHLVIGRLPMMLHLAGMLRGKILIEGAPFQDIDHLNSPADAQHRLVQLHRPAVKGLLQGVPCFAQFTAGILFLLPVQHRGDILSSGHQQAVTPLQNPHGILRRHIQRQNHRNTSGVPDALQIVGQHPQAVLFLVPERNHCNPFLFHIHSPRCFSPLYPPPGLSARGKAPPASSAVPANPGQVQKYSRPRTGIGSASCNLRHLRLY